MSPKLVRFPRFDRVERVVHWTNATLFFILLFTGAALKIGGVAAVVAHRYTVKEIHVYTGLMLPIPVLVAILVPAGRQFRRDLGRFNRWSHDDTRWWSRRNRKSVQLGKFNPGQKANAIFIGATIVVMLMTGSIMRWFKPFPDSWRTGATFVHDSTFLVLIIVIAGHVMFAFGDPDSLRSMIRGWVPEQWARKERPVWWAEIVRMQRSEGAVDDVAASADAAGDVDAGSHERFGEARVGAGEVAVVDAVDGGAADGGGGLEL
jgi:formate dehydrogenase subunit gamma